MSPYRSDFNCGDFYTSWQKGDLKREKVMHNSRELEVSRTDPTGFIFCFGTPRPGFVTTKASTPMIHIEVFYRVSNSRTEDADARVRAFVEELRKFTPHYLDYHIYQHAHDRSAFIHIISFPDREKHLEHTESQHVKAFVEDMLAFCVEGPVYTELEAVASIGVEARPIKLNSITGRDIRGQFNCGGQDDRTDSD